MEKTLFPNKMTKKRRETGHAHLKRDLKPERVDIIAYLRCKICSEKSTSAPNQLRKSQQRKKRKRKTVKMMERYRKKNIIKLSPFNLKQTSLETAK